MTTDFDQVIASYRRACESGQLFDTFYRIFLSKSPEIPGMFARTDFPHQKLMLRESLLEMLAFAQTGTGRNEIERLAERHRELRVTRKHYALWLDSLCEALAVLDCEFNQSLEELWRNAMMKGIELMTATLVE